MDLNFNTKMGKMADAGAAAIRDFMDQMGRIGYMPLPVCEHMAREFAANKTTTEEFLLVYREIKTGDALVLIGNFRDLNEKYSITWHVVDWDAFPAMFETITARWKEGISAVWAFGDIAPGG